MNRYIARMSADDDNNAPAGTVITWDDSARVYEAWATPSDTVRTYLGVFDGYDEALAACRSHQHLAQRVKAKQHPAPRGAVRDLTEALRLVNGVRTGYELTADEQRALLALAVSLRDAQQRIVARGILTDGWDQPDTLDRDEHGQPRHG